MQVRCTIYGLAHASAGVECILDQDQLEVGHSFDHQDHNYIIVSVVENQGHWSANVVPETQRRFLHWQPAALRSRNGTAESHAAFGQAERLAKAERKLQTLQEDCKQVAERLDHLMHLLDLLLKESEHP